MDSKIIIALVCVVAVAGIAGGAVVLTTGNGDNGGGEGGGGGGEHIPTGAEASAYSFDYSGVFGDFDLDEGGTDALATVSSDNDFPLVSENIITWEKYSDEAAASDRYSKIYTAISGAGSLMGSEPIEIGIAGFDDIVAYKVDVSDTVTITMLYFAALSEDQVVYAAAFDEDMALDRYGGIVCIDENATDSDLKTMLTSALASFGVDDALAIGSAVSCGEVFTERYNGVFGTFTLTDDSSASNATASGNGAVHWILGTDVASLYETYVSAIENTGASKVSIKGLETASIYTSSDGGVLSAYFVACTESMLITNTDGSASTCSSAYGATIDEAMVMFNMALKYLKVSVYLEGGGDDDDVDVRVCVQKFIDELYEEPDENATWDILEGATAEELYLRYTYYNSSNKERAVLYHITYEENIDSAFQTASERIVSYVGDKAIMNKDSAPEYFLYDKAVGDTDCVAVVYWGSGTSAARFALTSGNILIDGALKPYTTVIVDGTDKYDYPYMHFAGNKTTCEAQFIELATAFSKMYDGRSGGSINMNLAADWFVENYEEPHASGVWAVADGATSTTATLDFTYTCSNGRPGMGTVVLTRSDDIDSEYADAVEGLNEYLTKKSAMGDNYKVIEYTYDGIEYAAVGYITSSVYTMGVKFVMKVDDVLVDGSSPGTSTWSERPGNVYDNYIFIRPSTGQSEETTKAAFGYLLNTLKTAVQEHSGGGSSASTVGELAEGFATMWNEEFAYLTANKEKDPKYSTLTVTESDETYALLKYTYTGGHAGEKNEYIRVAYEEDIINAYETVKDELAKYKDELALGSSAYYRLFDDEIDGVEYYAILYCYELSGKPNDHSGIGCLRFVTYAGNILFDASFAIEENDGYPYIFLAYGVDHLDLSAQIIKTAHDFFAGTYEA